MGSDVPMNSCMLACGSGVANSFRALQYGCMRLAGGNGEGSTAVPTVTVTTGLQTFASVGDGRPSTASQSDLSGKAQYLNTYMKSNLIMPGHIS